MKTFRFLILPSVFVLLGLASLPEASAVPALQITVANSSGKVVSKGKTNSSGAFSTPSLAAGDYTVQFNTDTSIKGGPYALVVNAGKDKSDADSVAAHKFSKGGVAMKITAHAPAPLTVEVSLAGANKPVAAATPKSRLKTKTENGRQLVYIPPEQGGWLPGRWVPADSVEARNAEANATTKQGPGH